MNSPVKEGIARGKTLTIPLKLTYIQILSDTFRSTGTTLTTLFRTVILSGISIILRISICSGAAVLSGITVLIRITLCPERVSLSSFHSISII